MNNLKKYPISGLFVYWENINTQVMIPNLQDLKLRQHDPVKPIIHFIAV